MIKNSTLITGGCRSGKSYHALAIGNNLPGPKMFIATAQALDEEMEKRIEKHKNDRGNDWLTFEEPRDILKVLKRDGKEKEVLIIDCLTIWISNLMEAKFAPDQILEECENLAHFLHKMDCKVIVITNEIGSGIVPISSMGREFRDLAGGANQIFAKIFDEVICMISGISLTIKPSFLINQSKRADQL